MNGGREKCDAEAKARKSRNHPQVTRWQAGFPMAPAVLQLISARLSIPLSAVGIMGPTQHHVSSPSQARAMISNISHAALITCKVMILPRKAAPTINTTAQKGKALRCALRMSLCEVAPGAQQFLDWL